MAGGGTGGHVIPALAVARELRARGHAVRFIGTRRGMEAKLVPPEGFPDRVDRDRRIEAGRVCGRRSATLAELPWSVWQASRMLRPRRARRGVFDGRIRGGAGAAGRAVEPHPGGGDGAQRRARIHAPASGPLRGARVGEFPGDRRAGSRKGRAEVTGMPVREEFFSVPPRRAPSTLTVLITGGSQGSRTLNRAAEESWPLSATRKTRCA